MLNRFTSHSARITLAAFALVSASVASSGYAQNAFKVQQRWVIGGEGSWDYMLVNAPSHRLYIAHLTTIDVVDLTTGKKIGAVKGVNHAHGIVIPPDSDKGYISDGGANAVLVFDPTTLEVEQSIPTGTNPDGMVYEPNSNSLWVFNGASKNATVIDLADQKPVATIPLPGKPEFPTTDGQGQIFVNIEDLSSVLRIDPAERKVTATWHLPHCEEPSGMAIDTHGHRLFSVCDGHMGVTDYNTGKSLGTAKVGDGPDATAFDFDHQLAYASNEDGTLSIIDTSSRGYPVKQLLKTMSGARTMAFDATTGKIYTVSARLGPPPPPNPAAHHNRPPAIPGTFTVLVIGRD